MEDEYYNEYEEDIEEDEEDKDSDIDYDDFENNLESTEDKIELGNEDKNISDSSSSSSSGSDIEDNDVIEDDHKNIIDNDILKYKKENIENFSSIGMISYICNIVNYIKKGGTMLDTRTEFKYPDETEESYALECILLDKEPFEYIVNKKKINLNIKSKIMCLKIVLRCVDENKSIFFTPEFVKKFPIFSKSLMCNYVSIEELKEIESLKSKKII